MRQSIWILLLFLLQLMMPGAMDCALAQQASSKHSASSSRATTSRPASGRTASGRPKPNRRTPVRGAANTRLVSGNASDEMLLAPSAVGSNAVGSSVMEYGDPIPHTYAHEVGGCSSCGSAPAACICNPVGYLFDWSRADLWLGTTSFVGESSFLGSAAEGHVEGNFGFQQGFNFGSQLPSLLCGQVGAQIGMRFTQTQLDGTAAGDDSRSQTFLTAGLFRRVDFGLQGGLVVDYLHDDWVAQADLVQLRGEVSYLFSPCHDFGFQFTDSQQTDDTVATIRSQSTPIPVRLAALNSYRFFYRYRFGDCARGSARLTAGFTEESHGLLGVDLTVPLQNQLGLVLNSTYVIPPDDAVTTYSREGWNMGISITWTPGRGFGTQRDYYRPLMDVADNGSLLARRLP